MKLTEWRSGKLLIIIFSVVLLIVIINIGVKRETDILNETDCKLYSNDYYEIEYPEEWEKQTLHSLARFTSDDEDVELNIYFTKVESYEILGNLVEKSLSRRENAVNNMEETSLRSNPGYKIELQEEGNRILSYLIYRNGHFFTLEFEVAEDEYDDFKPIAGEIFSSFVIKPEALSGDRKQEAKKILSSEEAQEDVRYLYNSLEEIHPDLYFFRSREETEEDFAEIEENLKGRDRISRWELLNILTPFVAGFRDGHTNIQTFKEFQEQVNQGAEIIPFQAKIINDRLYVSGSEVEDLPEEARIIEINGRDAAEIIDKLREYSSYMWNARADYDIHRRFAQYYWAAFGAEDEYRVKYKYENEQKEIVLAPSSRQPAVMEEENRGPKHFEGDISLLTIDTFGSYNDFTEFVDDAFKEIAENDSRVLLIDIRNNDGGSRELTEYLYEYLSSEPYNSVIKRTFKISKKTILNRDFSLGEFDRIENDMGIIENKEEIVPEERENRFDGTTYILTGPGTYSAAGYFAYMIKNHEIAYLVGEKTGGTVNSFGDPGNIRLPHSGVELFVAHFLSFASVDYNLRRRVKPDFEMDWEENSLEDVLELVRERHAE